LCFWILRVIGDSGSSGADVASFPPPPQVQRQKQQNNKQNMLEGLEDLDQQINFDEDPDANDPLEFFEPAPRTHSRPYNEYIPGRKYFIYSPSGGWNNQRECLENAVEIGRLLNRTVYVPMAGKHTQFWRGYDRLDSARDLFPTDRVLDFPFLEKYGTFLVPINVSVSRFIRGFTNRNGANKVLTIFHPERENWHKENVLGLLKENRALIFLKGAEMYHHWFATDTMVKLKQYVRYAPYLRQLSVRIARRALGAHFYAMHIRMGDYTVRMGASSVGFLRTARSKKWKTRKYPTYVATEPARDKDYFAPLEQGINVSFSTDLSPALLEEFKGLFPPGQLRNDMLGLLEVFFLHFFPALSFTSPSNSLCFFVQQLICIQADDFVGTAFSTFSAWIVFARKFKELLLPEAVSASTELGMGGAKESRETNNSQ